MNIKSVKEKSDQLKSSLLAEIENDFLNLQAENCALLKDYETKLQEKTEKTVAAIKDKIEKAFAEVNAQTAFIDKNVKVLFDALLSDDETKPAPTTTLKKAEDDTTKADEHKENSEIKPETPETVPVAASDKTDNGNKDPLVSDVSIQTKSEEQPAEQTGSSEPNTESENKPENSDKADGVKGERVQTSSAPAPEGSQQQAQDKTQQDQSVFFRKDEKQGEDAPEKSAQSGVAKDDPQLDQILAQARMRLDQSKGLKTDPEIIKKAFDTMDPEEQINLLKNLQDQTASVFHEENPDSVPEDPL